MKKYLLILIASTFFSSSLFAGCMTGEIKQIDAKLENTSISEDKRKEIDYVFCVYDGIIQETYKVLDWFPGGSTYSVRHDKEEWKKHERWEFVGNISNVMRKKYRHKSVSHYFPSGSRNPARYTF